MFQVSAIIPRFLVKSVTYKAYFGFGGKKTGSVLFAHLSGTDCLERLQKHGETVVDGRGKLPRILEEPFG